MTPRLWLCIVLPLTLLASGCAYLPQSALPQIRDVRPRIAGLDFQGVDLAFDMDVSNPYPVPIKSPRFRYGLAVEETPLFAQKEAQGLDLAASKVSTAVLPVRLTFVDLWKSISKLSGANQAAYKLDGAFLLAAAGKDFELPFSHAGNFPIFQAPKFSVVNFKPSEVSLTKAKFGVDADVANPNVFGIGMGDLGYELRIGEIKLGGLSVSNLKDLGAGKTGRMSLTGETSALDAMRGLISGGNLGSVKIQPIGALQSPYGPIKLPSFAESPH